MTEKHPFKMKDELVYWGSVLLLFFIIPVGFAIIITLIFGPKAPGPVVVCALVYAGALFGFVLKK